MSTASGYTKEYGYSSDEEHHYGCNPQPQH